MRSATQPPQVPVGRGSGADSPFSLTNLSNLSIRVEALGRPPRDLPPASTGDAGDGSRGYFSVEAVTGGSRRSVPAPGRRTTRAASTSRVAADEDEWDAEVLIAPVLEPPKETWPAIVAAAVCAAAGSLVLLGLVLAL